MLTAELLTEWMHSYREQRSKYEMGRDDSEALPDLIPEIAGGEETPVVPGFMAGLMHSEKGENLFVHYASAVLVRFECSSETYLLTAGHNLNTARKDYQVYWGGNALEDYVPIDQSALHVVANFYDPSGGKGPDLALLHWSQGGNAGSTHGLVPLSADQHKSLEKDSGAFEGCVFGFGIMAPQGYPKSMVLQHAVMEIGPLDDSKGVFTCSSFDERGPCSMDSGGPMVALVDQDIVLAGIVLGDGADGWCHSHEHPTRFLSVSSFMQQLESAISEYESQFECPCCNSSHKE